MKKPQLFQEYDERLKIGDRQAGNRGTCPDIEMLWRVQEGVVAIYWQVDGSKLISHFATPGDYFGGSLHPVGPVFAECVADKVDPMGWPGEVQREMYRSIAGIAIPTSVVSDYWRDRETARTQRMILHATLNISGRLKLALKEFADLFGESALGWVTLPTFVTDQLLSEYVATSREIVTFHRGALCNQGVAKKLRHPTATY